MITSGENPSLASRDSASCTLSAMSAPTTPAQKHLGHRLANGGFVVNNQNRDALQAKRRRLRHNRQIRRSARGDGHMDQEGGTAADAGLEFKRVIEDSAQAIDDGEPQAQPLAPVALGVPELVELAKNGLVVFRSDTKTRIADCDGNVAALAPATDENGPLLRVADCIGDDVAQDATRHLGIALDTQARGDKTQFDALLLGHRPEFVLQRVENLL